jgi:hypothetical protein
MNEPGPTTDYAKIVLVILGSVTMLSAVAMLTLDHPQPPSNAGTRTPSCDLRQSEKAVKELFEKSVLYKIEQGAGTKDIYVQALWYQFPIDWKHSLDGALICIAGGNPQVFRYLDSRTGKVVATGGYGGFSME